MPSTPAPQPCTCRTSGGSAMTGPSTTACAATASRPSVTPRASSAHVWAWSGTPATAPPCTPAIRATSPRPPANWLPAAILPCSMAPATSNPPMSERSDYYDIGVSQQVGDHLTLGLDAYDRRVHRLQDEGQFGAAYIYSTFNYRRGHIHGLEFSADYSNGPISAYFNAAYNKAMGTQVITSQYN